MGRRWRHRRRVNNIFRCVYEQLRQACQTWMFTQQHSQVWGFSPRAGVCHVLYISCFVSVLPVGTEWLVSYGVIKFFCEDGSVFCKWSVFCTTFYIPAEKISLLMSRLFTQKMWGIFVLSFLPAHSHTLLKKIQINWQKKEMKYSTTFAGIEWMKPAACSCAPEWLNEAVMLSTKNMHPWVIQ